MPNDSNFESKEREKKKEREIPRSSKSKGKVVPVVVGALGVIPKNLKNHLKEIEIPNRVRTLQKSDLLGTATKF